MGAERPKRTWSEQTDVAGGDLSGEIKKLVHEGNVRHLRIMHDGHEVLEVPLTLAVAGGLIAPVLAALGAFAAVATHSTIEVVREEPEPPAVPPTMPVRQD